MLQYLHVKNLALIDEIEVEFGRGLNILTGETGAGKSIILGSVNLALGGRYTKDILRQGARYGLVELTFSVENRHFRYFVMRQQNRPECIRHSRYHCQVENQYYSCNRHMIQVSAHQDSDYEQQHTSHEELTTA